MIIESCFRDIKSFVEIAPVYVWSKKHVEAHYTICVLSYLIDRTLTLLLHEKPGKESEDIVTHKRIYEELTECRWNRIKLVEGGQETYGLTQQTTRQRDFLERIEMTHLVSEPVVNMLRLQVVGTN